jgi:hypothetical protein
MGKLKLFAVFLTPILLALVPLQGFAAEESTTVFRGIAFGDSQKTVRLKTLQDDFFNSPMVNLGDEALSPRGTEDLIINGHSFQLIFFFNKAGLYRLDLMGAPQDGDQFESLRKATGTLKAVLVPGLDEPTNSSRVNSVEDLKDGFTTFHYWSNDHTPGNREVFLGIARSQTGYKASLSLRDPSRAGEDPLPSTTPSPPELSTDEAARLFSSR